MASLDPPSEGASRGTNVIRSTTISTTTGASSSTDLTRPPPRDSFLCMTRPLDITEPGARQRNMNDVEMGAGEGGIMEGYPKEDIF
eukprot:1503472-Rhodomonas_salina.1